MRRIVKHANRRLYDAERKGPITLLEVSQLIVDGETVLVLDRVTGEDITAITILHALGDRLRRKPASAMGAREAERLVAALKVAIAVGARGGEAYEPAEEGRAVSQAGAAGGMTA